MMACRACSASCPSGRCSRIVNLVVRSTSVPMALLLRLPVMRSPLPVARDRPVPDLRGSLRDHDHGFAETGFASLAALGSAGGSPLPHGAFQLLLESAPGLQVDGLADRLDARVRIPIIREVQPRPVGYPLRAPMPAQPGGDLVPRSRALGRLARFGAFEPVRGLLPGPVGLVVAVPGFPLRHALPVRFETPTACAAWVKFMPSSSSRRTYSARLASHISFLIGYSTPLNAQRRASRSPS